MRLPVVSTKERQVITTINKITKKTNTNIPKMNTQNMNNYDERRVASYKGKQVRSFDLFTKLILSRFYKISEKYFILKFIILFDFIHIATN